ncbi:hypothetical protein ACQKP0_19475 [Heyndrickxia sp. NPDC080065]|uniref:hypothetical protein n=1 Tax=Heyndrickxia sp. NPDC080065 TaxID=3390568 RepID=UPI003D077BEF
METLSNNKIRVSRNWMVGIFKTFFSESILLAIFLFPIRVTDGTHTISWVFLLIMLGSFLIALILSRGILKKIKVYYYTITIPLYIIGSFIAGIPFWGIIIMIIFSQWRMNKLMPEGFDDDYFDNQNGLLLLTSLVGILMYGIGKVLHFANLESLLLLILLQLLILTYGTFIKNYLQGRFTIKSRFLIIAIFVVIIPLIIALMLTLISGGLRSGFLSFLTLIIKLLSFILGPLLTPFFNLLNKNKNVFSEVKEENVEVDENPQDQGDSQVETPENAEGIFYIIVFLAFTVLAIWAFIKFRRFQMVQEEVVEENKITFQKILKKDKQNLSNSFFNPGYSKAAHQIRKSVNELEKMGIKKKIGRKQHESAREWFHRIGINCSNGWFEIYEKIRYGKENITKSETDFFLNEYKLIKKQLKEIKPKTDSNDGFHNELK